MTLTFMKELMQWYKDQKKLHRKCAYQVPQKHPLPPKKQQHPPAVSPHVPALSPHVPTPQILVQVKEVLAKLPTLVETTLKEVGDPWLGFCGGGCGGGATLIGATLACHPRADREGDSVR